VVDTVVVVVMAAVAISVNHNCSKYID